MQANGKYLQQLKTILLKEFQGAEVSIYLFGSMARHQENRASDIDIGILERSKLAPGQWQRVREAVEESSIPYKVEIVNLKDVSKSFYDQVMKEGILWKP